MKYSANEKFRIISLENNPVDTLDNAGEVRLNSDIRPPFSGEYHKRGFKGFGQINHLMIKGTKSKKPVQTTCSQTQNLRDTFFSSSKKRIRIAKGEESIRMFGVRPE